MAQELAIRNSNEVSVFNPDSPEFKAFKVALESHTKALMVEPDATHIDSTADGKAKTVVISAIETLLDEFYFGLWSTRNFQMWQIANEVCATIDLVVIHPLTGKELTRVGAGAITIMVDAAPDELKFSQDDPKHVQAQKKRDKNAWSLDMQNKKPNALDLGFPKLKTECIKNAAISLGKVFGRDINRKKVDTYTDKVTLAEQLKELLPLAKETLPTITTIAEMGVFYSQYEFNRHPEILQLFANHELYLQVVAEYQQKKHKMSLEAITVTDRIIGNKEISSYAKLLKSFDKITL
jgi:hypothetical protein